MRHGSTGARTTPIGRHAPVSMRQLPHGHRVQGCPDCSFSPFTHLQSLIRYSDLSDAWSGSFHCGWINTAGTGPLTAYSGRTAWTTDDAARSTSVLPTEPSSSGSRRRSTLCCCDRAAVSHQARSGAGRLPGPSLRGTIRLQRTRADERVDSDQLVRNLRPNLLGLHRRSSRVRSGAAPGEAERAVSAWHEAAHRQEHEEHRERRAMP